ncbi:hypothetical protein [Amycolatopsis sp. NPDC004378]
MTEPTTPEATDPHGRPLGGQLERDGRLLAAAQGIDLTAGHADNANRAYWYDRAREVHKQLRAFGRDADVDVSYVEPCTITCDCGPRTVPWPRENVVVECETCGHKVAVAPIMDNYRSALAHENEQAQKVRELREQRDAALKLCADPAYWVGVPDEFAEAVRNALGGAR